MSSPIIRPPWRLLRYGITLSQPGVSRVLPQDIQRVALRKLEILDAAVDLPDLRTPPGNSAQFWLNLQTHYDLREAWERHREEVSAIARYDSLPLAV